MSMEPRPPETNGKLPVRNGPDTVTGTREFLQALLDSLQEGIVACDTSGKATLYNSAVRKLHCRTDDSPDTGSWEPHSEIFLADGETPVPSEQIPLNRALSGEVLRDLEIVVVPKNGSRRTVAINGQAIYDAHGIKLGAVLAIRDITDSKKAEKALAESQHRLLTLTEGAFEGIGVFQDGRLVYVNPAAVRLFGYADAEEMIGLSNLDLVDENSRDIVRQQVADRAENVYEAALRRKNGSVFFGEISGRHVSWNGRDARITVVRDITDRRLLEESQRQNQARLSETQRAANLAGWEFDVLTNRYTWSEELYRIWGFDRAKPITRERLLSCLDPDDATKSRSAFDRAISQCLPYDIDVRVSRPDGAKRWHHVTGRPLETLDGRATILVGTVQDITERKHVEERLQEYAEALERQKEQLEAANKELQARAVTDGLTGLSNHRAFQERLSAEVARAARYATPLCLVCLDVDDFKPFNDAFGHLAGDTVLKIVARVMQSEARGTDIVARYGGEEFMMILPQTTAIGAFEIADRVRNAIEHVQWRERKVTASFGIASLAPGTTARELIAQADKAMYVSKATGKNRVTVCGQHCTGSQSDEKAGP